MNMKEKKFKMWALIIVLGVITVFMISIYMQERKQESELSPVAEIKINGLFLPQPQQITPFNLTNHHGKIFSQENLNGHWTMMFFGFTNCATVCPTTMVALNKMYQSLRKKLPADQLPQIVMVSVDPDRDSVTRMDQYINAFNSDFIGVRADIVATVALEKQLHIVAAKLETDGQGKNHYTINHTADILVFNPKGQLQAVLSSPHQPDQMVKDYQLIQSATRTTL